MKVRPLIIDTDAKVDIRRLTEHAQANPVSLKDVVRCIANPDLAVGNNLAHQCIVKLGYRCVFSIEEQPVGLCRHLSVSVIGEGYAPNEAAVEMLMKEFGFQSPLSSAFVSVENIGPQKAAVNVVEKI